MTENCRLPVRFFEPKPEPHSSALPPLNVSYVDQSAADVLADDHVLAAFGFGSQAERVSDPRFFCVALEPVASRACEVWRATAPVQSGRSGEIQWSTDGNYLFFALEVDEAEKGGPDLSAEFAYRQIGAFIDSHPFADGTRPEILRLWNYLDAINEGAGDDERYRQFCSGRARGLGRLVEGGFSAATAIGRRDGRRVLQVYGLAARAPGVAIENPRQVSAWRYPREYGPVSPTFARATRTPAEQLLVSGTAAVVGHASQHHDDTVAQIDETIINLEALFEAAGPTIKARGVAATVLKAYVRDVADADLLEQRVRAKYPQLAGLLVLAGDICRRELRIEIDGIQA
jgi:chorismate lyase/3-hydroxybenzoate synthase